MRNFSKPETRPAYGIAEASRYLRLPSSKTRRWAELLSLDAACIFPISFANLLQLHLLKAMRLEHEIPLQRVRRALPELRALYGMEFPLLQRDLHTDGLNLFLKDEHGITNLSQSAQRGIRQHFDLYLRRIDLQGKVAKLYPFVRSEPVSDAPEAIVIRPDVGFGRPTISGTGILTEVVAGRFQGGDSIAELTQEYGLSDLQMEEVLRWERDLRVAAA